MIEKPGERADPTSSGAKNRMFRCFSHWIDELTLFFQREPFAWQFWIGQDSEDARRRQLSYLGSIACNPFTREKCRLLKVATWLPRSRAVAATIKS